MNTEPACRECGTPLEGEAAAQPEDELICEECNEKLNREAAEDRRLDDPRHNQADGINKRSRGW